MNQLMPVRGIFNEKMLARAHRYFHSEREDACEGGVRYTKHCYHIELVDAGESHTS